MGEKTELNGSVDLLAKAMRQVFQEGIETATAPIRQNMAEIRQDMAEMREDLSQQIHTTNENMQAQFAEQEKKISKIISKR